MILVDTSVWIDYFNGIINDHTEKLDELLTSEIIITGDVILAEILQGFKRDSDFKKAKEALDLLDCYALVNKQFAVKSAENYRYLRKKGITIRKTTDMIIGTFCIENKIPLLHNDKDFDKMKPLGLQSVL